VEALARQSREIVLRRAGAECDAARGDDSDIAFERAAAPCET